MEQKKYLPLQSFIKLSSTNYVTWAFTMKHHIGGKGLLGYIDGSEKEPILSLTKTIDGKIEELTGAEKEKAMEDFEKKWEEWRTNNRKVIYWLLTSVDTATSAQVANFELAHKAWDYLKEMHTEDIAYKFNIQVKIIECHQGDKSIRDYYVPSVDEALAKLIMEENMHFHQRETKDKVLAASRPGNYVKPYGPPHFSKNYEETSKKIICFHCHEVGHIKPRCPKLRKLKKKGCCS